MIMILRVRLAKINLIFEIINEHSNGSDYQLFLLENNDPISGEIYKPYKVLKNVCSQIEAGARVMVRGHTLNLCSQL